MDSTMPRERMEEEPCEVSAEFSCDNGRGGQYMYQDEERSN